MKKIYIFLMLFLAFSCSDKQNKRHLPHSTGKLNSVLMVLDTELWNAHVGDSLREKFARAIEAIPSEAEPLFSIIQVPPQVFSGSIRHNRNILFINTEGKQKFFMKDSLYAKPQKVAYISGKTTDEIIEEIQQNASQIIQAFYQSDIQEAQKRMHEKSQISSSIKLALGVNIRLPEEYPLVKEENNFFWTEKRLKSGTANIVLYTLPLDKYFQNQDTLPQEIMHLRDSIGKQYIPGPSEDMYMMTEPQYSPIITQTTINNLPCIEGRGLWIMKDFMLGGPYLIYLIKDQAHKRWIIAEGFVVAPGVPKRDLLFEMEAIIKTITIE